MKTIIRSHAVRSLFATTSQAAAPRRDLLDGLLRRAAHGDRDAITTLARSYRLRLLAEARKHARARDVEDVVQDLFVLLLEEPIDKPSRSEPAVAWLRRTLATLAERR
jgi:DNA-directed RNA polymerase specialized sigma24 family protein